MKKLILDKQKQILNQEKLIAFKLFLFSVKDHFRAKGISLTLLFIAIN